MIRKRKLPSQKSITKITQSLRQYDYVEMGKLLKRIWRICREKGLTQYYPHEEEITESHVQDALFDSKQMLWQEPKFYHAVEQGIRQFTANRAAIDSKVNQDLPKSKSQNDFPPDWIKIGRGGKIWRNLSRKKNRCFIPIYKILLKNRIGPREPGADGFVVLVQPPYKAIQEAVKKEIGKEIAERKILCYLAEMQHWGIIRRHHRNGEGGQWVYAIGEWAPGSAIPRPSYYLKRCPEMEEALLKFDASLHRY